MYNTSDHTQTQLQSSKLPGSVMHQDFGQPLEVQELICESFSLAGRPS